MRCSLVICAALFVCSCAHPGARPADLGESYTPATASDLGVVVDLALGDDAVPCTAATPLLLAGVTSEHALYTAALGSAGWTAVTAAEQPLSDVALAEVAGQPLLVARQIDSTLAAAAVDPCSARAGALLGLFVGATTAARPAVAGGAVADVIFHGGTAGDSRYFHTEQLDGSWSAAAVQATFLSNFAPVAVRFDGGLHALFTGTDRNVYDGTVADDGHESSVAIPSATSPAAPAAVVEESSALDVVFTGDDAKIYWSRRAPGGSFSAPTELCAGQPAGCDITTDAGPTIALDAAGGLVVGWHGSDHAIYTARLAAPASLTLWSPALKASGTDSSDLPPALAPGRGGFDSELVYVRKDGTPVHVRLAHGGWTDGPALPATQLAAPPALVAR